jgi:hypothetical protein
VLRTTANRDAGYQDTERKARHSPDDETNQSEKSARAPRSRVPGTCRVFVRRAAHPDHMPQITAPSSARTVCVAPVPDHVPTLNASPLETASTSSALVASG